MRALIHTCATLLVLLPALATGAVAQDEDALDAETFAGLAMEIVLGRPDTAHRALATLTARRNPDTAASLIMAMRYARGVGQLDLSAALSEVTGETGRTSWFEWMLWQEDHPEITPHPGHTAFQRLIFEALDPRFLGFLPPDVPHEIRLEEIVWGGVRVDGIPALTNPTQLTPAQARYINPDDEVFGVEINGDARAYPLRILNWHEMFNDVIGGVPVSLAYCTLCGAGILFATTVEGRAEPFVFGSSGFLYRSNKLMYDRETRSLWNQFTGRPVVGPLTGSGIELEILPVTITSWEKWLAAHPDTTVIDIDTGFSRDYGPGVAYREYFSSSDLMFPAVLRDERLREKDQIFGIRAPGGAKAWPLKDFTGGAVINDTVGLTDVVLVGDAATRTVRAYGRTDAAERFAPGPEPDTLALGDEIFDITEAALVSRADGTQRTRVAGHVAFWFAWVGYLGS